MRFRLDIRNNVFMESIVLIIPGSVQKTCGEGAWGHGLMVNVPNLAGLGDLEVLSQP